MQGNKVIGIALVGLGEYAESQVLPALKETSSCKVTAAVTDDKRDKNEIAGKYGIDASHVYYYEEMHKLKNNDEVQLIYIMVPNHLHRKYCEEAAACQKHVLCEKPMAVSTEDCRAMIDACRQNNVRLFIGYRLHFEPHHETLINLIRRNKYGKVLKVASSNGFHLTDEKDWRLKKEIAGGGSMMDMGIYIINECRQIFQQQPVSVTAKKIQHRPELFKEVEESLEWEMKYKDGAIAKGFCSYYEDKSELLIEFENGKIEVHNAYRYEGFSILVNGEEIQFDQVDHKTDMMKHVATCIIENKKSKIEAEEGLMDIQVIEAVYRSMENQK